MKKVLITLVAIAFSLLTFAQIPQKMSYQAVIRNSNGNLITNSTISMRISIIQNSESGQVVYAETQQPQANANGLISIEIGNGNTSDDFSSINWKSGVFFIKTEIDPLGGSNYTIIGINQLLSVPYALHSKTAESISGTITENQNLADVISKNNSANGQIKNLTNPTESQDAATKAYVDLLETKLNTLTYKFELSQGTSLLTLINNGASIEDLISAGASIEDLINAGVNTNDLINAGLNVNGINGKFQDSRDSYQYNFIGIGNQIWMAQNLAYLPFVNAVKDGSEDITLPVSDQDSMYYYVYDYDGTSVSAAKATSNYQNGGALYNWKAASDACPDGWHLPSYDEWQVLVDFVGTDAGEKLKSTTGWNAGYNGTNNVGFAIYPVGERSIGTDGYYTSLGYGTRIWTSSRWGSKDATCFYSFNGGAYAGAYRIHLGYSVRCIKD